MFSANRGLDPYVFAVSDLYQDVFGDGSFTGKGLYHVDAFEAALEGRIDENTILSHDLLEGALARSALVTDVELVEDYPTRYSVDASRQHRWARGDWQLLGFILDPRSGVPALSRWKMVDNLRRSLTPIFWVMAAVAGWTLLPFTQAAQWQALLILTLFMAPTFDIVNAILPKSSDQTPRGHFSALARDVAFGTAMVALQDRADGPLRLDDGRRHRPHALPLVGQPAEPAANGAPPRRRTRTATTISAPTTA